MPLFNRRLSSLDQLDYLKPYMGIFPGYRCYFAKTVPKNCSVLITGIREIIRKPRELLVLNRSERFNLLIIIQTYAYKLMKNHCQFILYNVRIELVKNTKFLSKFS